MTQTAKFLKTDHIWALLPASKVASKGAAEAFMKLNIFKL